MTVVDRGCVDMIGVEDSCVDAVVVDMGVEEGGGGGVRCVGVR